MMNKKTLCTGTLGGLLTIIVLLLLPTRVLADNPPLCRAPDLNIPDAENGTPGIVTDTLVIATAGIITDLNISISATHDYVGDLVFTVEHVDTGNAAILIDRPGVPPTTFGCNGDNIEATLDDEATTPVEDACVTPGPVAIAGDFVPNTPLSIFAGEDIAGTWVLTVSDQSQIITGTLVAWCLIPTPQANLDLNKTVDNTTPDENDPLIYTVTVNNSGPDEATGVVISDTLPVSVTLVTSSTTQGSYDSVTGLWQLGSLAASESATLTLETTVNAGTVGQRIINTAIVSAAEVFDPVSNNNGDSAISRVTSADLAITKTASNEQPTEAEPLIYMITVNNNGPASATDVLISDTLPLSLTFAMSNTSQGEYDESTGIWNLGKLQASQSATLTLMATVNPGTAGQLITNTAEIIASEQNDNNRDNNISTAVITVTNADLAVSKGVDNPRPTEGDSIVYTVAVNNNGPDDTSGVIISDTLPLSLTLVASDTSQGSYDDSLGRWDTGSLAASEGATLTLTATVEAGTAGQIITNTAVVSASNQPDSNSDNNSGEAGIFITSANLAVNKTVSESVLDENDPLTYTVTVSNIGPDEATGVVISDTLPLSLTLVASNSSQGGYDSGAGRWEVGDLTAGESVTLTLEALVEAGTAGQTITNTAGVGFSEQHDPDSLNNVSTAVITITNADLAVTKQVNNPNPTEGEAVIYTVTLTNSGPDEATGVVISDTLPLSLTLVTPTTSHGSYSSSMGLWEVGNLLASESATLTLETTVNAGTVGQTLTNTAQVSAAERGDTNTTNNADQAVITVIGADLAVGKTDSNDPVTTGEVLTYTVTVTNTGPLTATGIVVTDTLPGEVTFISLSPDSLCAELGGVITCTLSALNPHTTATVTIAVSTTLVGTMTNTVNVVGLEPDPNPSNNTANEETIIGALAPGEQQIYLPVVVKE